MKGTTDTLLATALRLSELPAGGLLASLLKTGEDASVALLTIALTGRGVNAHAVSADALALRTRGPLHDAEPVGVDVGRIAAWLRAHDVVVVPGFIGTHELGPPSLLGRGGSDLTALFLAAELEADEVRLVKDVDGVHPTDPRLPGHLSVPLETATWSEVARIGNGVVQEKALLFAERRGLSFRVSAPSGRGTRVGAGDAS
jgi:homoserine dehydrogenase